MMQTRAQLVGDRLLATGAALSKQGHNFCKNEPNVISLDGIGCTIDSEHNYECVFTNYP